MSPSLSLLLRGKMIPEELEKEIQRVKAEVGRGCALISPKPPKLPNASPVSPMAFPVLSPQSLSNVPKALKQTPPHVPQYLPQSPQCPPK